jgi:predicted porin
MKKNIIALSVLMITSGAAMAGGKVYGHIDTSVDVVSASAAKNTGVDLSSKARLNSNQSFIGIKASEHIGGAKVWAQVEGAIESDTGNGSISSRNTGLGISGVYGTLKVGNWDTPYKTQLNGLDPFASHVGALTSVFGGYNSESVASNEAAGSFHRRAKNSVSYTSPSWYGLTSSVAYGFGEDSSIAGSAKTAITSVAFDYKRNAFTTGLAYEHHKDIYGVGVSEHATRISGTYDFGVVEVGALAEQRHVQNLLGNTDQNSYGLVAKAPLANGVLKASYARLGNVSGVSDSGAQAFNVGFDYPLSKRTAIYTHVAVVDNYENGSARFGNTVVEGLTALDSGVTLRSFGIGVKHSF